MPAPGRWPRNVGATRRSPHAGTKPPVLVPESLGWRWGAGARAHEFRRGSAVRRAAGDRLQNVRHRCARKPAHCAKRRPRRAGLGGRCPEALR
eukprot:3151690-Lingulodinium_polyedra.AAC.1